MSLTQVRALIQDQPQFSRFTLTGDGVKTRFRVDEFPILEVLDTTGLPTIASTDNETGLITFDSAPGDGVTGSIDYNHAILSDASINTILSLEDNDVLSSAAQALESIAANQTLVLKKITLLNLQTDGPSMARELRQLAKRMRERASASAHAFAEWVMNVPTAQERIDKELNRES